MKIVCIAGAGLSTASGIPDFKGPNGLYKETYNNINPEEILDVRTLGCNPQLFYDFIRDKMNFSDVKPNDAHFALKELEDLGVLKSVITQNIDGLEHLAGIKNVRQVHGSLLKYHCIKCHETYEPGYVMSIPNIPRCHCGGLIRPDVVLYGEMLDESFNDAMNDVADADILLIVGTSLSVQPIASLPQMFSGNKILIFNEGETSYDNHYLVTKIKEPLEVALPNFVKGLKVAALELAHKKGD